MFLTDIFLQSYFRTTGYGIGNRGISFGWLPGLNLWLTIGVYLTLVLWTRGSRWTLIWGGLGNLLPRWWWGGVWDYLHWQGLPFWFNLADVLISWGVISYILDLDEDTDFIRRRGHSGDKQAGGRSGEPSRVD